MSRESQKCFPPILKVQADGIPALLKARDQWVVWEAGPPKPNGKFDKIPISPSSGRRVNALDESNWNSFQVVMEAHEQGRGDGIGIVLSPKHPVRLNDTEFILTALDFDNCRETQTEIKEEWLTLGKVYVEVSPSGEGIRMLALSTQLLKGGNDGNGHEMYASNRFMTITGQEARGQIKDATAGLLRMHQRWFGDEKEKAAARAEPPQPSLPETAENVALIKEQLSHVSADTPYETYRSVVWSIMSTRWKSAEAIAREWSMQAAHRYDEAAFDKLVASFDPSRGITPGTLRYHASEGGWRPRASEAPGASQGAASTTSSRLLTAEQVKAISTAPYRVKGLLPARGMAAMFGEPGTAKSFLALDLAFRLSSERADWFGMPLKPAPVIYVALEGQSGLSRRIKAWEKHNKTVVSRDVRFLVRDFTLLDAASVKSLAAEIVAAVGMGAVIFVDTLNQSAPGADENAAADMGRIISNAKALGELVEGLVVLIHHAGKDRTRGLRGHSSLLAAMDAVIEVAISSSGERTWRVTKAKDDEGGASHGFELVSHVVGVDDDGLDITSCAVRGTVHVRGPKVKPITGKHQVAAIIQLGKVLQGSASGISHADAIKEVAAVLDCPSARRSTVAKETIDKLLLNGHLFLNEGEIKLR